MEDIPAFPKALTEFVRRDVASWINSCISSTLQNQSPVNLSAINNQNPNSTKSSFASALSSWSKSSADKTLARVSILPIVNVNNVASFAGDEKVLWRILSAAVKARDESLRDDAQKITVEVSNPLQDILSMGTNSQAGIRASILRWIEQELTVDVGLLLGGTSAFKSLHHQERARLAFFLQLSRALYAMFNLPPPKIVLTEQELDALSFPIECSLSETVLESLPVAVLMRNATKSRKYLQVRAVSPTSFELGNFTEPVHLAIFDLSIFEKNAIILPAIREDSTEDEARKNETTNNGNDSPRGQLTLNNSTEVHTSAEISNVIYHPSPSPENLDPEPSIKKAVSVQVNLQTQKRQRSKSDYSSQLVAEQQAPPQPRMRSFSQHVPTNKQTPFDSESPVIIGRFKAKRKRAQSSDASRFEEDSADEEVDMTGVEIPPTAAVALRFQAQWYSLKSFFSAEMMSETAVHKRGRALVGSDDAEESNKTNTMRTNLSQRAILGKSQRERSATPHKFRRSSLSTPHFLSAHDPTTTRLYEGQFMRMVRPSGRVTTRFVIFEGNTRDHMKIVVHHKNIASFEPGSFGRALAMVTDRFVSINMSRVLEVRSGQRTTTFGQSAAHVWGCDNRSFSIVFADSPNQALALLGHRTFDFVCDTVEHRDMWLRGLQLAMAVQHKEAGKSSFLRKKNSLYAKWKELFPACEQLTHNQLRRLFRALQITVDRKQMDRLMRLYDANQDNRWDKDECERLMLDLEANTRSEVRALLKKFSNNKEYLTTAEFQWFLLHVQKEHYTTQSVEQLIAQHLADIPTVAKRLHTRSIIANVANGLNTKAKRGRGLSHTQLPKRAKTQKMSLMTSRWLRSSSALGRTWKSRAHRNTTADTATSTLVQKPVASTPAQERLNPDRMTRSSGDSKIPAPKPAAKVAPLELQPISNMQQQQQASLPVSDSRIPRPKSLASSPRPEINQLTFVNKASPSPRGDRPTRTITTVSEPANLTNESPRPLRKQSTPPHNRATKDTRKPKISGAVELVSKKKNDPKNESLRRISSTTVAEREASFGRFSSTPLDNTSQSQVPLPKSSSSKLASLVRPRLSLLAFVRFLKADENSIFDVAHDSVHMDLDRPLGDYFIASSHNTYLLGNQYLDDSSVEGYIYALRRGARCLELDLWDASSDDKNVDGKHQVPIVIKHGHARTTAISFEAVLHAINDFAFENTLTPVILSLENHCNAENQRLMAVTFRRIFGRRLMLHPEEGASNTPITPNELLGKILLKGKQLKTVTKTTETPIAHHKTVVVANPKDALVDSDDDLPPTPLPPSRPPPLAFQFKHATSTLAFQTQMAATSSRGRRKTFHALTLSSHVLPTAMKYEETLEATIQYSGTSDENINNVLFLKALKAKATKEKLAAISQRATAWNMSSFTDTSIETFTQHPVPFAEFATKVMCRIYPDPTVPKAWTSGNYNPFKAWKYGCQAVAMNYQRFDKPMQINEAFFNQNGGCGYVLKPEWLRDPEYPFDFTKAQTDTRTAAITLTVRIISAQNLVFPAHKSQQVIDPFVVIQVIGVPADKKAFVTRVVHENGFNPLWDEEFRFTIYCPELAVLHFEVVDRDETLHDTPLAYYCLPVTSIREGYRHAALKKISDGTDVSQYSTLFCFAEKKPIPKILR